MARILRRKSSDSDGTIHVATRTATPPASRMVLTSDDAENPLIEQEHRQRSDMREAMDVDPTTYAGKGKGRASEIHSHQMSGMVSVDSESVEEYVFSSDDEMTDGEDELSDYDDAVSHISLSSDDDQRAEVPDISERPWVMLDMKGREGYESMFSNLTSWPMGGSWSFTEEYQHELDKQMLKYMETFPLQKWLMPRAEAEQIYSRFLERMKWRELGTKIYGAHPRANNPPMTYTQTMPPTHRPSLPYHSQPMQGQQYPPPPQQTLRSQPYDQPLPVRPGVHMGQPVRQTMHFAQPRHHPHNNMPMPPGMNPGQPRYQLPLPNGMHPHHMGHGMPNQPQYAVPPPQNAQMASNRGRPQHVQHPGTPREESSPALSPPPGVPVPPYAPRQKPDNRKTLSKIGRGKGRRAAEAEIFPWNRQMDFRQARIASRNPNTWNLGIYDKETLDQIRAVQTRNAPIIDKLEKVITEKQREQREQRALSRAKGDHDGAPDSGVARSAMKSVTTPEPSQANSDEAGPKRVAKRRTAAEAADPNAGNDAYQSGNFAWATPQDQTTAAHMGRMSPDDMIVAGELGQIDLDKLARVKIVWNPGKKGHPPELEQATFSVRDTVLTRKQLNETPVLNRRATECIIDFCPDLLWRDVLLRILSEGAYSNKEIRERFLLNGSSSDRATVAKRLSAALGKDTNPPRGGGKPVGQDEGDDWHDGNRDDFDAYQAFFGKRPPARRSGKAMKSKREADTDNTESSPAKRQALERPSAATIMSPNSEAGGKSTEHGGAVRDEDGDEEMAEEEDGDAVSIQGSEDLDAMSD